MATGVGLRIGADESVAVIVTSDDSGPSPSPSFVRRESVLHMNDEGDAVLGEDAPEGYLNTAAGFLDSVGDPDGFVVDSGVAFRAEDLVATAMFCLINLVADQLAPPTEIVATYPAAWSRETVDALRDALDYLGLRSLTLLSEAELAVAPGDEAAHGAALSGLSTAVASLAAASGAELSSQQFAQLPTEEFPVSAAIVTGPIVTAQAYSLAPEQPTPVAAAATVAAAPKPAKKAGNKVPLLVAAAVAAALAIGGSTIALTARDAAETEVPAITDAKAPPTTTSVAPAPPVALPTVEPTTPPPAAKPVSTPEPTFEPPPAQVVVSTTPPPPPPPPPTTPDPSTTTPTTKPTPPTPTTTPNRRLPIDPLQPPTLYFDPTLQYQPPPVGFFPVPVPQVERPR